jgi:hypothetical protein
MNIPDHYQFFGLKALKFFMRIRIRDLTDPGSGIRDKHPGSTTLLNTEGKTHLQEERSR